MMYAENQQLIGDRVSPLRSRSFRVVNHDTAVEERAFPLRSKSCEEPLLPLHASANPQSPTDDNPQLAAAGLQLRRENIRCEPPLPPPRSFPLLLIGFILVGMAAFYTSRETVISAAEQVAVMEVNRQRIETKVKEAESELNVLKREITAVDLMLRQEEISLGSQKMKVASYRALNEMNSLQKRLKKDVKQAEFLKQRVQESSRAEIARKFGTDAHLVEIELVFPDGSEGPNTFVIELAPADVMPHAVHTFLEMASNNLLDGCSFILNALHVIKAAPLPYDGSSAKAKAKAFSELGLESVTFKEYNQSYPHKQYTVGFAADGSPSFYINTADNTEIHAGDPCFGKVIEGIDTIKRLEASPTRNGIWFERRIGIKSARVIKSLAMTQRNLRSQSRPPSDKR